MSTSSSTIKINLQAGILANAKREADRIGISLQDFVRLLLGNYFIRPETAKTQKEISLLEKAREEVRNGQYTTVKNRKELNAYLKSLSD